jgi:hypothetical protein
MNTADTDRHRWLEDIRALELELQRRGSRRDRRRMEELLHPEFVEFGRSGRRYSRQEILEGLAGSDVPAIRSGQFDLVVLARDAVLLTYVSACEEPSGKLTRFSLRSSVWVRTEGNWQIRFHQ